MRPLFPLFQSPLDLAHSYWIQLLQNGDTVIDATCGNGHDTLKIASFPAHLRALFAFDIQEEAIQNTTSLLKKHLPQEKWAKVILEKRCHSIFPSILQKESVKLIIYNLGYLPGGDKTKTTLETSTLTSIRQAQELLQPGGVISIACYPGHLEGEKEQEKILIYSSTLCPKEWSCCHHSWTNRRKSPTLLLIQKNIPQQLDNKQLNG